MLRNHSCKTQAGALYREGEQSKMFCLFLLKNQANILKSKPIFFSERKVDCVLSHRIFPEEEGKGRGSNLIG